MDKLYVDYLALQSSKLTRKIVITISYSYNVVIILPKEKSFFKRLVTSIISHFFVTFYKFDVSQNEPVLREKDVYIEKKEYDIPETTTLNNKDNVLKKVIQELSLNN